MPSLPRPLSLRLLADDLTGALDSAAAFAGAIPVHLDPPPAAAAAAAVTATATSAVSEAPCGPVEALATATRDIPQAALPAALACAIAWLQGADIAFKKVDSLLRGNTFAEAVHIARAGGFDEVVFAPAFPAQGRFLLDGRLCLRPPGQTGGNATADDGPDCRAAFAALGLPGHGISLTLPELRSDADLREIARGALLPTPRRRLWCGSAGLAQAMAHAMAQSMAQAMTLEPDGAATDAHTPDAHTPGSTPLDVPAECELTLSAGPTLLLTASHHPVLRQQWQRLRQARPQALAGGRSPEPTPAELLAALAERRQPPPDDPLIVLDLSPAEVLAARPGRGAAAPAGPPGGGGRRPPAGAGPGQRRHRPAGPCQRPQRLGPGALDRWPLGWRALPVPLRRLWRGERPGRGIGRTLKRATGQSGLAFTMATPPLHPPPGPPCLSPRTSSSNWSASPPLAVCQRCAPCTCRRPHRLAAPRASSAPWSWRMAASA